MANLTIKLKIAYGKHKAGEQVDIPYSEATPLINSGGATLIGFADERQTKEDKAANKSQTK